MNEPKAFASLSSGLLARKGAARPAMRPQGFGQVGANGLDDLGWNDMGFEAPKPTLSPIRDDEHDAFGEEIPAPSMRNPLAGLTPASSPVHEQHEQLADVFGASQDDETEEASADEDYDDTAEPWDPESESVSHGLTPTAVTNEAADLAPVEVATPVFTAPVATPTFAPAPVRPRRPRAQAGSKGKAAFTLRLDGDRHLKLRLACAVDGRSAQQLVTEALDQLLAAMPELDTMAEKAPKKRTATN